MVRVPPARAREPLVLRARHAAAAPLDLEATAGGDVLAARRWAKQLLASVASPEAVVRDAELILIAALLQVSARISRSGLCDALELIVALAPGSAGRHDFAGSPMQFVQFVAAEIADLDSVRLGAAIACCCRALSREIGEKSRKLHKAGK